MHVPWYLCDSMREPLRQAGIASRPYAIDGEFRPAEPLALGRDEWLLVVNYFGLCDGVVADLQARHTRGQIVVDNAQAFFAAPTRCRASLYSPRKFFGVPGRRPPARARSRAPRPTARHRFVDSEWRI